MFHPAPKVAFILQVKITISPTNRDAFLAYLRPVTEKVMAEPQCAYFFVGENVQEPGVFHLTEGWTEDVTWFMANQITKAYYEPYLAETEKMFIAERVATACSPVDGLNHVQIEIMK